MLEKAPKEEEARFRLGYLRLQREDFRAAAEAFEGLPALSSAVARSAGESRAVLQRPGQPTAGRAAVPEDARERIRKSVDALRGLAAMAIQVSDFEAALEYHVRLVELRRALGGSAVQHRPDVREGRASRRRRRGCIGTRWSNSPTCRKRC